jgi:D-alanyl-D-alanine carboxypeptidase
LQQPRGPIKPNAVRTVTVHPGSLRTAALSPLPSDNRQLEPASADSARATVTTITTVKSDQPPVAEPSDSVASVPESPVAQAEVATVKLASAAPNEPTPASAPQPVVKSRTGWIIQIGALPDEKDAWQRLELAQGKLKGILGKTDPFTERIEKGEKVLFRARFAGLEKTQAEAACKHLKHSNIPCMLLRN